MATPQLTRSVREYMREIGRKGGEIGGKSKSQAKTDAARANGHKGGRPKRVTKASDNGV